jgi:hypothetical protein
MLAKPKLPPLCVEKNSAIKKHLFFTERRLSKQLNSGGDDSSFSSIPETSDSNQCVFLIYLYNKFMF